MAPTPKLPKKSSRPFNIHDLLGREAEGMGVPDYQGPGSSGPPPKAPAPPKPKGPPAAVRAYGERNPPNTGPKDPEPSPGTGKLPLPKPKPPRPRGIPGGGQGGAAPPGFGGPRRIPPIPGKAKPSYGEASILRFITTKPRPK